MSSATTTTTIFDAENPGFKKDFDEEPFEYSHSLTASHPLFEMKRMRKLIEPGAVTRDTAYHDAGDIRVNQRWETIVRDKLTVEDHFDQVGNVGAWMMIRFVHRDPEYNELLDQCLREVKELTGREIDEDKKSKEAIIFMTSPNRVTAYHIDRECNFLMQVIGEKTISIFNRNDREVVPEQELELFWSKDNNAGVYKPQYQDRAFLGHMRPGRGVHIPVNSPHWVQNGNNVSVSFSISYQYKDWRRKNVYQANYYLRKLGLNPTPPGRSVLLDNAKRITVEAGLRGKKLIKGKH